MKRWKLGLLTTEQEAAAEWAAKGRLYNLTYAVNHIDDIHGPDYVNKVWELLMKGQDEAFQVLKGNVSGKAFTEFERQIASKKTVDQALAAAVRIDRLNAAVVAQIKNTMQTKIDAVFDYMHGEFLGGRRFW